MKMTSILLLKIGRCPELSNACGQASHQCHVVARTQGTGLMDRSIPEPWSGHLSSARILFITANPSLDADEQFPRPEWSDVDVEDFFENRFAGGAKRWTRDGSRVLRVDGSYSVAVQTWAEVRNSATIVLGRDAIPGEDYAITDVVHCKSRKAVGVAEAHDFCVSRYMNEILNAAKARVLIAVGPARISVGNLLLGRSVGASPRPVTVGGVEKIQVGVGAPGSSEKRRLPAALENPAEDLATLRAYL